MPSRSRLEPDQPANPKAYENYLLGRYFWNKRDGGGLEKAIHYFQQSISDDPNYAPAYAGLAQSYELSVGGMGPPQKTLALARDAAQHALSLNSRLAEAHTALALIRLGEYNFAEEERELRLAIDADPNYSTAHHWYGEACLALFGRFDEANREMQKAMSLDPASRIIATDYAVVLYWQRRYPEAYAQLNHVLEMDPGFSEAYLWRSRVLLQQKKYQDAIADLETAQRIYPESPTIKPTLAYAYGIAGESRKAQALLADLLRASPQNSWAISVAYLGLGEKEKALDWAERAVQQQSGDIVAIGVAPECDVLRSNPRFQALLRVFSLPN